MRKSANRNDSGMILLSVIIMLLIVSSFAAVSMTTSALEVHSDKGRRAQEELQVIADAVKRYGEDVLKAQFPASITQSATVPFKTITVSRRYLVFPDNLNLLLTAGTTDPTNSPTYPSTGVWKGPYLTLSGTNVGFQHVLDITDANTGDTTPSAQVRDPWGTLYEITPPASGATGPARLQCRLRSLGANRIGNEVNAATTDDDDLEIRIDLNGFARRESEARIAIINRLAMWSTINTGTFQLGSTSFFLPTSWNAATQSFQTAILSFSPSTDPLSGDINQCVTNWVKNGTFEGLWRLSTAGTSTVGTALPDDPRYLSDAWADLFEIRVKNNDANAATVDPVDRTPGGFTNPWLRRVRSINY